MRIGLSMLVTPGAQTGVGRQVYGLLAGLQGIDQANEYRLYSHRQQPLALTSSHFRRYDLPIRPQSRAKNHLFHGLVLPLLAARHDLGVVHIPNTMPIVFERRPTIVTLYDVAEFALAERVYERGRHGYRRLVARLAARQATAVITTSQNTKSDLVRYLGVDGDKVHVIYPGIDHEQFRPLKLTAEAQRVLRGRYQLPERFLLYVGKVQPRKNVPRLLEALGQVRRVYGDVHLVLAGTGGWMNQAIGGQVERLGLEGVVHFPGFVADADLPALYGLAEMLVFPSLYEGFGFPVVEAMACGTPVVTSAGSSLAEVADGAAICVDPANVEAIAAAIRQCLGDSNVRASLRQAGLARVQGFSWARCAAETLACYRAVASG
jgi:glycosyltransferase involved in cell wall biosynthesis